MLIIPWFQALLLQQAGGGSGGKRQASQQHSYAITVFELKVQIECQVGEITNPQLSSWLTQALYTPLLYDWHYPWKLNPSLSHFLHSIYLVSVQ